MGVSLRGLSALLWAHHDAENIWSWKMIREYYYKALTPENEIWRQGFFARTFRGLGHQMHLLQDMAVPAHVRNDAHPFPRNQYGFLFEPWATKNEDIIYGFTQLPTFPHIDLFKDVGPVHRHGERFDVTPIAQLSDTDTYIGTNPSAGYDIGLAEYINANFFSEDTVFAAENHAPGHRHHFPYPRAADTNLRELAEERLLPVTDIHGDNAFFIKKLGGGEVLDHLARATYHTLDVAGTPVFERTFYLDETCYTEYAGLLVPRAIRPP